MKFQKMWAERDWECGAGAGLFISPPVVPSDTGVVPVLVQEIPEGMPDFKPGDRVSWGKGCDYGACSTIAAPPYLQGETWRVPLANGNTYPCDLLTKLPRETSVLLRVTGPEEEVDMAAKYVVEKAGLRGAGLDVQVERVGDPDAKGGER